MNIACALRAKPLSIGIVLLALWFGTAWQPAAAALPDAIGTFNTNVSSNVVVFPAGASFACGAASITASPLPALSVSGTDCPDVLQAILTYYFQIAGPAGTLVPISVASTHTLAATGSAQAGYSLSVAGQTIDIDNCYFARLAACGSHDSTTAMSLAANQIYGVTMMTAASNFLGAGAASAFLDPQFSFASNFANAAEYAFDFSPGIGNGHAVSPVPEPETLSMVLFGLAAMAGWKRRRRNTRPRCRPNQQTRQT